jgi:ferritin
MLSNKMEKTLNEQIAKEAYASNYYLALASWCDDVGFVGTSKFMFAQSSEERDHMMRIFHYVNDAGGRALAPEIKQPPKSAESIPAMFENVLEHERSVTKSINNIVDLALEEKDYTTFNFLQWFVEEQLEEEDTFETILDRVRIAGEDNRGLYLLDRELGDQAEQAS